MIQNADGLALVMQMGENITGAAKTHKKDGKGKAASQENYI